jgi:hypothetical protein
VVLNLLRLNGSYSIVDGFGAFSYNVALLLRLMRCHGHEGSQTVSNLNV